jgi:hypothetical protein
MVAPEKLTQNSDRLSPLWQADETGTCAIGKARIRLPGKEHADLKQFRIEATSYLSCVSHLRIRQTGIGKAVYKDPDWLFARRNWDRSRATSLCSQLNAPILFEGLAVETPYGDRSPVTFEIPPGAFSHTAAVPAELVVPLDRPADVAQQGPNSS